MPSLNWFSLNRPDGGAAYFWHYNRTSAPLYWNDWLYGVVITAAAFLTILVILSPAYKRRWMTLSLATSSVLFGGAFVLGLVMPEWQSIGPTPIVAPIRIHDAVDLDLILDVHVGLNYVNITLIKAQTNATSIKTEVLLPRLLPRDSLIDTIPQDDDDEKEDGIENIYFNERIELLTAAAMRDQIQEALQRGLPLPILTVLNYLTHQEEGFRWSVDLRLAGFYCQFILTITLITWAWMNIFFLVIPRYGAATMIVMGLLALLSVLVYWLLLPARELVIYLSGNQLRFKMGGCYWTVLVAGFAALITGTGLLFVDLRNPGAITFDFELETDIKKTVVEKTVERRSIKAHPSVQATRKASLKPRISVIDGTACAYADKTSQPLKSDSGFSGADSCTTSGLLSQRQLDSSSNFDHIATLDGSYLRSTVTNLIQAELPEPKIYSYTFREGRELPSFHESTISLHSRGVPVFLNSITEEIQVHRSAYEDEFPSSCSSSEKDNEEEWQDPMEAEDSLIMPTRAKEDSYSDEVFESELDSTIISTAGRNKAQSPRRRPQRAPSIGSHRDILGVS